VDSISAAPDVLLPGFAPSPKESDRSVKGRGTESVSRSTVSHFNENLFPASKQSQHAKTTVPQLSFSRIKPRTLVNRSLLTSLLSAQSSSPENPFSELYASVAARGQESCTLFVYFPRSKTPNKPMELIVQPDATVEEVIGFSLWTYWEEKWKPSLDSDCKDDDETTKLRLSAVCWNLRIAEDDGEVDEDFPCKKIAYSRLFETYIVYSFGSRQAYFYLQFRCLCSDSRDVSNTE
jgi:hypothetical protein